MSPYRCEYCPRPGIRLEHMSEHAWVNYYRCANGHVWQVSKAGPEQRDDVTPPPPPPTPERGDAISEQHRHAEYQLV